MLVNFETKSINLNELKKNENSILLVEGDIIVPDVNPDIKKLLLTDASVRVTEKEATNGKINISGDVLVNILYSPETDDENFPKIKSINTKLDFSDSFDFSAENPSLSVKAEILSLNCTLINSRKVNVKITVNLSSKAYLPETLSVISAPAEGIELEAKKQIHSIHSTLVDMQKEFTFSETLSVPNAKCDIEEILKTNINIIKGECRVAEKNILLKGTINITTLYTGFNEGFTEEFMEHELPFTQTLDVEGLVEDCMCNVTYDIKNVSLLCQNDENGDPREMVLDMTITANITASKIYDTEFIEDLYIPGKVCELKKTNKTLKKSVLEGANRVSLKNTFTLPEGSPSVSRVYSITSHPVIREHVIENNKLILKGDVTAFILFSDANGALNSQSCDFRFEHALDIDSTDGEIICEYELSHIGTNFNIISESEIEIRTNVEIFVRLTENFPINIITECIANEISDDKHSPQLIIYFVQKGDTLWDIAKHYNTTTKRIKDANHIESISSPGEKLLIPAR